MADKEQITKAIYNAIDELNPQAPEEEKLEKSLNTQLYGQRGKLDSLGLVTFIVAVEEKVQDDFKVAITIADERAMSQKHSPFKTINTLADYILKLLEVSDNE